jgi:hypothetical protein
VYVDSAHTVSNFGQLRLVTSAQHTDLQQMKAAGWLEGYLTAGRFPQTRHSVISSCIPYPVTDPLQQHMHETLSPACLSCIPSAPVTARINDHHHNLKHYFKHQLQAKLEKPMKW